jgi:hypothetical protein
MNQPPSRLTLLFLIDALRPDYVTRAPFLSRLAASSATGVLREGFGFVPRAAYFGGLTAEQYGFTNMYCYDPARSPFTMARAVPVARGGAAIERHFGLRQLVEAAARERVPPFAKHYASSGEIPLEYLACFDLAEKRAPWDAQVGYASLFGLLDERGLPWYQCAWPETNRLSDRSDEGIVRQTLRDLRDEHRFAFVHLQQLDHIGHAHGPNSAELHRQLAATDALCEQLVNRLRWHYDELAIVLFGDHGMVNVTRTINVWEALEASDLRFGVDYAFFLDSSMARFWFYHRAARAQVEGILRQLPGGRLLTEADLERYSIARCDWRNAELIFLADPGVLISPNFFHSYGEPVKGMHGYDSDCPDNLGFFLLHDSANASLAGRPLGKVNPPALFPLLKKLIGLPTAGGWAGGQVREWEGENPASAAPLPPSHFPIFRLAASGSSLQAGRFTGHPDPAADQLVAQQLEAIAAAILIVVREPEAVVLTGSFGRGEGGVFRDAQGELHPVNDYDLLVVSPCDCRAELKQLGHDLAAQFGLDYVDLGWSDGQWHHLPLTVAHYDLKYGSQVLAGDQRILDRLPPYASADLPIYEAVKLLLNRSAGLLAGLRGELLTGAVPSADQRRYLANQIAKALMAIGDWHLIRWQGYDASYRLRSARFASLAPGAGLDPVLTRKVTQAYEFKCEPDYARFAEPMKELQQFYPQLELSLVHAINLMAEGYAKDLAAAMTLYLQAMSSDPAAIAADNALCSALPEAESWLKRPTPPAVSLRHLIYSVVPFLVVAALDPGRAEAAVREVSSRLQPFFDLPVVASASAAAWERLRAFVVRAWFAFCH